MKDESGIVHEISIEGSIENVFDAIAQAQQRMAWWGQGRFPVTRMESDLRPGGKWEMWFKDSNGSEGQPRETFRESR